MNNDEIRFISSDDLVESNEDNNYSKPIMKSETDDIVTIPDWDLTPPFDSIDRGDMS